MEFDVCLYKENMAAQSSGAVIAEMCHFPHFANGHKICTLFDFLHPSFSSTSQTHNGFEVIVKEVFCAIEDSTHYLLHKLEQQ